MMGCIGNEYLWKRGIKMLELILLIGYIIIFGSFYLIWKYWYISKVDKFIKGKGWDD